MNNSNGLEELAKLAIYGYEKKIKQILKWFYLRIDLNI
jgi:hypothetical protein